jgi:sugar phosphate isomerase/epimerase
MKLSLSTNWCNRRFSDGREISDKALELGFDSIELGFHTLASHIEGIVERSGEMPVGSVHAFCPVPISAPAGFPELYSLASFDEGDRMLARTFLLRNIAFTASLGADTLVVHAGKVGFSSLFRRRSTTELRMLLARGGFDPNGKAYSKSLAASLKTRRRNGIKMLDVFKREIEALLPVLEKERVTIAFENLPYLEAFPNEEELGTIVSDFNSPFVKGWFDTGHYAVRVNSGYTSKNASLDPSLYKGAHINDIMDFNDDHLPPGEGKIDFTELKPVLGAVDHVVFEPSSDISEEKIKKGKEYYERQMQS